MFKGLFNIKLPYDELVKFLKEGFELYNWNYNSIKRRMFVIEIFLQALKSSKINESFDGIEIANKNFFTGNIEIKDVKFSKTDFSALYAINSKIKKNDKNTKGVAILPSQENNSILLYFGARQNFVDRIREDTYIEFAKNKIVFHHEDNANYEEIPLYGEGGYGEFYFDDQDRLIGAKIKVMEEPRLRLWSDLKTIKFASGYFKYPKVIDDIYWVFNENE